MASFAELCVVMVLLLQLLLLLLCSYISGQLVLGELSHRLVWSCDRGRLSIGVQVLTDQKILGAKGLQSKFN